MGAIDRMNTIGTAKDSPCWTLDVPDAKRLRSTPYFVAMAEPFIDGSLRLFYPNPKKFPAGFACNPASFLRGEETFARAELFSYIGRPFICHAKEENSEDIQSILSITVMRGSFEAVRLIEKKISAKVWRDCILPLYVKRNEGSFLLKTTEIVQGKAQEVVRDVPDRNVMYYMGRKSNSFLNRKMLVDERTSYLIIGNKGRLMCVSPAAREILGVEFFASKPVPLARSELIETVPCV